MGVITVMSVYEEEDLLPRALESLLAADAGPIHVFDGAWRGFEDGGDGRSKDRTVEIAKDYGCVVHERFRPWESQEAKRTHMFQACGAHVGDHIFVLDADEEVEGSFADEQLDVGQHYNAMVKCVGPNDMPGIRGEWPHGDYFPDWKPEIRVFAWDQVLHCKWPGGYWDQFGRIEPYLGVGSALPILSSVRFLHHGNDRTPERIERKIAFYEREHPRRVAIQQDEWNRNPW